MIPRLLRLLDACMDADPPFSPTEIYNETWLLRLFLEWFSTGAEQSHPLSFAPGAHWFSHAQLPSAFLPRYRGDPLGETRTRADGVIGHFLIGRSGKSDLSLAPNAGQFDVIEAKLLSPLSSGTKHVAYFDQAARTVACMAEALSRVGRRPSQMLRLGYHVLAPQERIDAKVFDELLSPEFIGPKVRRRVSEYGDDGKDQWLKKWFEPTLEPLKIACISWDSLLVHIAAHDPESAEEITGFYQHCLEVAPAGSAA